MGNSGSNPEATEPSFKGFDDFEQTKPSFKGFGDFEKTKPSFKGFDEHRSRSPSRSRSKSRSRSRSRSRDRVADPQLKSPGGFGSFGQTELPLKSPGGFGSFGKTELPLKSSEGITDFIPVKQVQHYIPKDINIVMNQKLLLGIGNFKPERLEFILQLENKYELDKSSEYFSFRDMAVLINLINPRNPKIMFIDASDRYKTNITLLTKKELNILNRHKRKIIINAIKKIRKFNLPLDNPFLLTCTTPLNYDDGKKAYHKDIFGASFFSVSNIKHHEFIESVIGSRMIPYDYAFFEYIQNCVSTIVKFIELEFRFDACPGTVIAIDNSLTDHSKPFKINEYDLDTDPNREIGNTKILSSLFRQLARDHIIYLNEMQYESILGISSNKDVNFTSEELDEIQHILLEEVPFQETDIQDYLTLYRQKMEIGGGKRIKRRRKISKRKLSKKKKNNKTK
jgi:hypothetical protein